jgi:hypothetical protein
MTYKIMNGSGCKVVCPKFDNCSAPICPIDPEWKKRVHIKGDPVCFYMREHSKHGHRGQNRGVVAEELLKEVVRVYPEALSLYAPLKSALKKASCSPSKRFSGESDHE